MLAFDDCRCIDQVPTAELAHEVLVHLRHVRFCRYPFLRLFNGVGRDRRSNSGLPMLDYIVVVCSHDDAVVAYEKLLRLDRKGPSDCTATVFYVLIASSRLRGSGIISGYYGENKAKPAEQQN